MARRKIGRNELIEKSGYLFRTRGYANTSIADIASACGLSKASIYHHINSKQELAIKVVIDLHENLQKTIFNLVNDTSQSFAERATNFMNSTYDFFKDREGGCLMGNLVSELIDTHPDFRDLFVNFFNDWSTAFKSLLILQYPPEKAEVLAQDFIAQIQGSIMLSRLHQSHEPLKRITNEILAILLNNSQAERVRDKITTAISEKA